MPKERITSDKIKNTIAESNIAAKGEVHIGDKVTNVYNSNNLAKLNRKKKTSWFQNWLAFTLLSVTLFGVSITIKEFNIFKTDIPGEKNTVIDQLNTTLLNTEAGIKPILQNEEKPKDSKGGNSSKKPEPKKPEISLSKYIDLGQSVEVAMFNSATGELTAFREAVESQFSDQGISMSNSFLRLAFQQKFGSKIKRIELAALREIGLSEKLNCICQIVKNIKYEPNEVTGIHMVTARGRIHVHILNLKTGKHEQITITENGAGISDSAALISLEEHLLQSEKLNLINTQQCK